MGVSVGAAVAVGKGVSVGLVVGETTVAGTVGKIVCVAVNGIGVRVGKGTIVVVFVGDPVGTAVAVRVEKLVKLAAMVYSTCRRGASAGLISYARATRLPLPLIIITTGFPATQPD